MDRGCGIRELVRIRKRLTSKGQWALCLGIYVEGSSIVQLGVDGAGEDVARTALEALNTSQQINRQTQEQLDRLINLSEGDRRQKRSSGEDNG